VAGLYDEATDVRVPAYDSSGNRLAQDRVQVAQVEISGVVAVPTPQFPSYYLFLPWVSREPAP